MWGIWSIRSPSSSLGFAEGWARDSTTQSGHREYDSQQAAAAQAKAWNEQTRSGKVTYFAKEFGS